MRGRVALAGGTDADETRVFPKFGGVSRTQVAHAGLNAADELGEDTVHGAGDLFQRFNAFRCNFARSVRSVSIARRRTRLHRREAAHAAVLFVKLAADFDDFAGRL